MAVARDTYVWKITDRKRIQQMKSAKNLKGFDSDIFKMHKLKWYLQVYPNGDNEKYKGKVRLILYLAVIPSHLSKISVRFQMRFVEGDEVFSYNWAFDSNKMTIGPGKWFDTNKLLKFNTFTFEIRVQILQLYDVNGKEIEEETENKVENIGRNDDSLVGVRINSLETRIDEIFKMVKKLRNKAEDDEKHDHNMLDEIKSIKRDVILLKQNMNENNNKKILSKKDKLKKWLTNEVELPSYYNIFIENGIEDLEVAKFITMETLKEMQITKIGHKMKIMQKVAALNHDVAAYEGINVLDTNQ